MNGVNGMRALNMEHIFYRYIVAVAHILLTLRNRHSHGGIPLDVRPLPFSPQKRHIIYITYILYSTSTCLFHLSFDSRRHWFIFMCRPHELIFDLYALGAFVILK